MNRENVQLVRDHIASLKPARFEMQTYFGKRSANDAGSFISVLGGTNRSAAEGSCGSCACIAGHALSALDPDGEVPDSPMADAGELLGLSESQAGRLFEPNNYDRWFEDNMLLGSVTLSQAVQVLDHLLKTGRVSWREALRKPVSSAPSERASGQTPGGDKKDPS